MERKYVFKEDSVIALARKLAAISPRSQDLQRIEFFIPEDVQVRAMQIVSVCHMFQDEGLVEIYSMEIGKKHLSLIMDMIVLPELHFMHRVKRMVWKEIPGLTYRNTELNAEELWGAHE